VHQSAKSPDPDALHAAASKLVEARFCVARAIVVDMGGCLSLGECIDLNL
jgi:hypothetical protein